MENKTFKITIIIFLIIVTIVLSVFFINILTNKNFRFFNFNFSYKVSKELVFNEEYETIFEDIRIDSEASEIEIKKVNEPKVKVIIYENKKETTVDTTNNKLNITSSKKNCIGFCFNITIAKIEIYLPSNYSGNVNINNNYGDVFIDKFNNLVLDAKIHAGDIEADSLKFGKIKSSYGDINILGYSKELEINQDCGDVSIDTVDKIQVKNSYGDIEIKKANGYLDIKDDCGDIEIDSINLKENSTINNSLGDIEINSTNEIYINAKTSLGDVKINNNYHKSDVILNINNNCGDIKINN